jgi:hypothetical protein
MLSTCVVWQPNRKVWLSQSVTKAAHSVVALQHQHAFSRRAQQGGQPQYDRRDAGSNDDSVPLVAKNDIFVRSPIDACTEDPGQRSEGMNGRA